MSTRVRPFGRCSRDPPLYRPQLGNLNHLCHRTALHYLRPSFRPFSIRPRISSVQVATDMRLTLLQRETSQGIVYLELFNKFATDHIYRNGCFNFQKEMSKTACLEFLANRPL